MSTYTYNNQYLLKDGKPWFPVMGEIHFSRYREDLWEESLRKMKAGGLSIASVYVIWNHHEEEEGSFDFTGGRNLKKFLEMAKKVGIQVFLRIGPWVHGEARNGGFPDWLQHKDSQFELRSDAPEYLAYVRRYWTQVYEQAKDVFDEEASVVIGLQIENEYGHVGGSRGEKGEQHMRTLAAMAKEIGFQVPLYTATGWGGAVTGGLLPVMGGYCEAPWDQSLGELAPNANYIFSHIWNDSLIASDHHIDDTITFDQKAFPFLTAELGGGLQVTQHRRPIASGKDIGAMSLTKLGSGVALLGYYMYHGGSNPDSKLYTLQESRETGYLNDLPEINYDFNAPIRQYGTISDNYREIRLLAYFLQDFGADMATLPAEIEPEFLKPEDMHTLRTSWRHDDKHGYVFVNNYQRRCTMDAHEKVALKGKMAGEPVIFPEIDIASGEYVFFPYNMQLGEATLVSTVSTPLCCLKTEKENVYVFYGDRSPQFVWKNEKQAKVLHISRSEALRAARVSLDQEYLVFSEDFVWEEDGQLKVCGEPETRIRTFPRLTTVPEGFQELPAEGEFGEYIRKTQTSAATVCVEKVMQKPQEYGTALVNSCGQAVSVSEDSVLYEITISYPDTKLQRSTGRDTLLWLDYACESMELFVNGRKRNDYFWTGQKALISLGYLDFPEKLLAVLYPLHEGDAIYLQEWPEMKQGQACEIYDVQVQECIK